MLDTTSRKLTDLIKAGWWKFLFVALIGVGLVLGYNNIKGFINTQPPPSKQPYNIIMVHFYPLRADHLGCYGYTENTSPHIDKLAEESVVFLNNFSSNSLTISAFTSILTSLYPQSHGVFYVSKDRLSSSVETLGEILQRYGYKNVWFSDEQFSFMEGIGDRGFEEVYFDDYKLTELREDVLNWLEQNKDKKFFLLVSSSYLHAPYYIDPKYRMKFVKQKPEGLEVIESEDEFQKAMFRFIKEGLSNPKDKIWEVLDRRLINEPIFKNIFQGDYAPEKFHKYKSFMLSRYKPYRVNSIEMRVLLSKIKRDVAAIEYSESLFNTQLFTLDVEIIKPLIKTLKRLSLYDKTIIIFCSSHGQEFGDHGGYGHGLGLHEELMRVPLIIKVPGSKERRRVQQLTNTVDILPTLLDLLEIPVPHYAQGKSLMDFITGKETLPVHEYIYGQTIRDSSIRSKEWKLILGAEGKNELYHIISDHGEQQNLYQERKDVALRLESRFKEWEESLPSYVDEEYPFLPEIDKATQERIKKTGYW